MSDEAAARAETTEVVENITSLATVFDTEPEKVETETKATETQETETEVKETTAETTTAKAETTQEPGKQETDTPEMVPYAALKDERRKRQELEKKLKEAEPVPDPIEDPEGYVKHIEGGKGKSEFQLRVDLTRELMLESKEDYAEKEQVFLGLLGEVENGALVSINDQSLLDKFNASLNPAKFAYEHAVKHLRVSELSDPKYEENLRAKIRAEILAEQETDGTLKATEMPDLTTATAKGGNTEEVEQPTTLSNVFG